MRGSTQNPRKTLWQVLCECHLCKESRDCRVVTLLQDHMQLHMRKLQGLCVPIGRSGVLSCSRV